MSARSAVRVRPPRQENMEENKSNKKTLFVKIKKTFVLVLIVFVVGLALGYYIGYDIGFEKAARILVK